jgi:hypothetical protein
MTQHRAKTKVIELIRFRNGESWFRGSTLDLYVGDARFESRQEYRTLTLTEAYTGFLHSPQANAGFVSSLGQERFLSIPSQIIYHHTVPRDITCSLVTEKYHPTRNIRRLIRTFSNRILKDDNVLTPETQSVKGVKNVLPSYLCIDYNKIITVLREIMNAHALALINTNTGVT